MAKHSSNQNKRPGPFEVLLDYEERSLAHEAGRPEMIEAPGHWRGVGFRLGQRRLVSSFDEVVEILPLPPVTVSTAAMAMVLPAVPVPVTTSTDAPPVRLSKPATSSVPPASGSTAMACVSATAPASRAAITAMQPRTAGIFDDTWTTGAIVVTFSRPSRAMIALIARSLPTARSLATSVPVLRICTAMCAVLPPGAAQASSGSSCSPETGTKPRR